MVFNAPFITILASYRNLLLPQAISTYLITGYYF